MPIKEGHATVVYRRENGQDLIYSQSMVYSCYVPLFVKFTYTFPPMIALDRTYKPYNQYKDVMGSILVSRLLFEDNSENITNPETHPHLTKVIAAYNLPFTTDLYVVPTLWGMGIYTTDFVFDTFKSGNKFVRSIGSRAGFESMYIRYFMNRRLQSFFEKYYNQSSLYPLFTGVLPESFYTPDTVNLFK